MTRYILLLFLLFVLAGCENNPYIVNDIDEREANEIVVFLASKGITANKIAAVENSVAATGPSNMWSITVNAKHLTDAMAYLNRAGLPRRKGASLLDLFAKQGLMSSDREENIRFQAGLAEELKNTIRKIDGILDVDVQISFPIEREGSTLTTAVASQDQRKKITAAVYVKHMGILEDPNNQFETKIKRLLAGSVQGLEIDNVSVIADRSRFAELSPNLTTDTISGKNPTKHVSVWSVVMTKGSVARFRLIMGLLIFLVIAFGAGFIWIFFTSYPGFAKEVLSKVRPKKKDSSRES